MSTKFCISQLKSRKSANEALRNAIIKAKGYSDLDALVKDWTGGEEFAAIKTSIEARATAPPILLPATDDDGSVSSPPPASQLLSTKSCDEIVHAPWVARISRSCSRPRCSSTPHERPYPCPCWDLEAGSRDADAFRSSAEKRTCVCS